MNNEGTDYLRAENFNRSIEAALKGNFDKEEAVRRVTKRLANCPEGKLYIRKDRKNVSFYERTGGGQKYIRKNSEELYGLARRKYLEVLLKILEMTGRSEIKTKEKRDCLIGRLQEMVVKFEQGRLNLSRIVLSQTQYNWYYRNYRRKPIAGKVDNDVGDNGIPFQKTGSGETVRSKSERDIGNALEYYAVPYHYEEQLVMYVAKLVSDLGRQLAAANKLDGPLFDYYGDSCHWNVPKELDWMNSRGSLWKTYNDVNGTVTIYDDFSYMLSDQGIGLWEHEGNCKDFIYRVNAGERLMVLRFTGSVKEENLISTFERDVNNARELNRIIEERILPRLWF